MADEFTLSCPIPISQYPQILLAHGGGGKLMHQLIEKIFGAAFANEYLDERHDGAALTLNGAKLAFTTDSYVVRPLFFPGGDIGKLAVYGTVNDLAMCGARPLFLSAGFILEEGTPHGDPLEDRPIYARSRPESPRADRHRGYESR
jgi:hydrogenase expression/formation protein HypE